MIADVSQADGQTVAALARRVNPGMPFLQRGLIAAGLVVATALLLGLIWYGGQVLLLFFLATLLAVFVRGLSSWLAAASGLSERWSFGIVAVGLIALVVGGGALLAPATIDQTGNLIDELPTSLGRLRGYVAGTEWGQELIRHSGDDLRVSSFASSVFSRATGVFSTTLGVLGDTLVVAFLAFFLAYDPRKYQEGALALVPADRRPRARQILRELGRSLSFWAVGRGVDSTVMSVLTGAGLWFLGVPFAIPLGLLTGLLNFVPFFGPILAAIPAVLVGLTVGPATAVWVIVLYFVIQNLEGYIFLPLIQQEAVSVPPELTIGAVLLFGVLFGPLGMVLAVPLTASAILLTRRLYIEDWLGENPDAA
jgi:predicted PurR-regulated permease PerM